MGNTLIVFNYYNKKQINIVAVALNELNIVDKIDRW